MLNINKNFLKLKENYLFSDIAKKVKEYSKENPDKKIIKLGIGDVTLPLTKSTIEALNKAVIDMSKTETFKGYGPEQGYDFLRDSISKYYNKFGVKLDTNEIFIGDGAKSDISNITDLFDKRNIVLVPDPVYPVYVDTNIINGRKIKYIDSTSKNDFLPMPNKKQKCDIIYLCSPNNPTGSVYNKKQLEEWVEYALINKAIILYDSAYHSYISQKGLPRSIYEVKNAEKCAIEFCSLSKSAGFTGLRLGYTIVPNKLIFKDINLNKLWFRRQSTKFNGVSYVVQKAAEVVFTKKGQNECKAMIEYYMNNAEIITEVLKSKNIEYTGGINSPYIWLKCPNSMKSWEFFDYLLHEANIVGTPGSGFGKNGEGYFRLTGFNSEENTKEAAQRLNNIL
ncbi:MAG: LL-diaminopimelate aminotransferase [Clostridia bacterium]|nr:LL-diaminopimelate aminotransferase [Clostridia bacterium]